MKRPKLHDLPPNCQNGSTQRYIETRRIGSHVRQMTQDALNTFAGLMQSGHLR